ncbi:MAG: condensation domain-containing protein, partial [Acidobacteria bacterium]|nr:condensation domain-containing protein [Acidobacteriota bacterium]
MKRDITSDQLRIAAAQNNKEKAYWSAKFQGEIQESHFPYDFPVRDGKKTGSGTSRQEWTFDLPGEIYARLIEACKNSDPRLHMILAAGIAALLYRYLEHDDIVTGMPIYRQEGAAQFINTALALRLAFNEHITFKELLNQVRETIREAIAHQDYPVEILAESLDLEQTGNGFPLFDTALLLENIHDRQYLEHIELNMIFCCQWFKETERIKVTIQYNPDLYRQSSVAQIAAQYTLLLEQALLNLHNPEVLLTGIELLAEPEKKWLLETINATATLFPRGQSLVELFNQHVQQTPQQVAVISDLDLNPIYDILESPTEPATGSWETLKKCCFKKNPYIASYKDKGFLAALGIFTPKEIQELTMLRTHRDNYAAVDRPVLLLLEHLQGQLNLESLLRSISPQELAFRIFPTYMGLQSPSPRADRVYLKLNGTPAKLISLIKVLYKLNLIEFTGYRAEITPCEIPGEITSPARTLDEQRIDSPGCVKPKTGKNPVLLLGDRTGPASTGLLYIASFLRRNGIEAYCQWNDLNQTRAALTANIRQILDTIQPKIVGVSMKWFPHIARVLEICRQVKTYDPSILVVVGGNTASYYKEKIIQYDFIDYVIMGDGEVPFLEICQGKTLIKNSVYRQNGEIICNPVTYVQGETADGEFFLSHLEEIFVSKLDPYLTPHFYINTGKGCPQQCIYCAGCRDAQKKVFNRSKPFLRGIAEVRKDLIAALEYTRWFMYDFDLPFYGEESSRYYEQIWEGIDFSGHFCRFYFWQLPSLEFIELVVRTFKYVELNIDLCSLSEAYRLRLSALYMVKPQPTDAEILAFFDACEKYDQIAVIINLIIGLPHLTPADLEKSEQMLAYLLKNYRCFKEMDWGRLHAQPGAPIVENSHKYNMTCYAHTFEDFLHYSRLNMEEDQYPDLWTFNYPYIYFQDEEFNSQITNHYFTAQQKIQDHLKVQRRNIAAQTSLTFMELHEQSNVLAGRLKERGIGEGVLVGLYMHRSQEMITVILAILKTGAAYLPLDPNYPLERIRYMLTDSNTQLLVTTKDMANQVEKLRGWNKAVFYYPAEQNPAGFFHVTASTDHIPAAAAPAYAFRTEAG